MSNQRSVRGTVTGRVQGVAYRASFQRQAQTLGLVGWVRNEADGSVAFRIQGAAEAVQAMLEWAGQGPRLARVDTVTIEEVRPEDRLRCFEIRYPGTPDAI